MQFKNLLFEVDSVVLSPSSVAYVLYDYVHSLLLCALCLSLGIIMTFFILLMCCLRISYMNMLYFN